MNDPTLTIDRDETVRRMRNIFADALHLGRDVLTANASGLSMPGLTSGANRKKSGGCECGCRGGWNCGCCSIPETECPPRCACRMRLAAMTGQTVSARIRVLNEAKIGRTFHLSAMPFVYGAHQAEFTMAPATLTIPPGGSALSVGTLVIPASFAKGRYQSEILVKGSYEQCVEVLLEIGCDEILTGTCTVEQLERRYRIRAHHWYDHFQCIEPCDEPEIGQREGD
jgi:hypothetical protein